MEVNMAKKNAPAHNVSKRAKLDTVIAEVSKKFGAHTIQYASQAKGLNIVRIPSVFFRLTWPWAAGTVFHGAGVLL